MRAVALFWRLLRAGSIRSVALRGVGRSGESSPQSGGDAGDDAGTGFPLQALAGPGIGARHLCTDWPSLVHAIAAFAPQDGRKPVNFRKKTQNRVAFVRFD